MRKRILVYEPNLAETALLILFGIGKGFFESFWPHPYYHTFCKHAKKKSFRTAVERLRNRGLMVGERQKGRLVFTLSPEGEKLAKNLKLKLGFAKPRSWDGRWRVLIFDIPEKVRGKRDLFRKELQEFGFYPLQKSVLVYPYSLPQEFFELWSDLNFGKDVFVFEAAKLENDEELRRYFGL